MASQCQHNLPAVLQEETQSEYDQKFGIFIKQVEDISQYPHIHGKDQIRIYVDGVFDMFHFGHAMFIMKVKNLFPNTYVIAGVAAGSTTLELKGQTVMTEAERCESVRMCRYVDLVICPAPWVVTQEFLKLHRIDFVANEGDPYPMGDIPDIYKPLKDSGKFIAIPRSPGVSTSGFITRIIYYYDLYLQRNLERGYSRHDLNITFLKEKQLEVRKHVEGVQKTIYEYGEAFLQHFYKPISDKISSFVSPDTSPVHLTRFSDDEGEDAPSTSNSN